MMAFLLILFIAFVPANVGAAAAARVYGSTIHNSNFDCWGKPDGVAEIGCDGMLQCINGKNVTTFCDDNQFFDRNTMSCKNTAHNTSGCTNQNICDGKRDGLYADLENNCQTYHTCHNQIFYGHQYCSAGLVFSEELMICNWANQVAFPCGTLLPTTNLHPVVG